MQAGPVWFFFWEEAQEVLPIDFTFLPFRKRRRDWPTERGWELKWSTLLIYSYSFSVYLILLIPIFFSAINAEHFPCRYFYFWVFQLVYKIPKMFAETAGTSGVPDIWSSRKMWPYFFFGPYPPAQIKFQEQKFFCLNFLENNSKS